MGRGNWDMRERHGHLLGGDGRGPIEPRQSLHTWPAYGPTRPPRLPPRLPTRPICARNAVADEVSRKANGRVPVPGKRPSRLVRVAMAKSRDFLKPVGWREREGPNKCLFLVSSSMTAEPPGSEGDANSLSDSPEQTQPLRSLAISESGQYAGWSQF
ncbi:hypothetical protein BT67DRAFT_133508 [Trichocladium antarcticum]|uniref:Uncharacterized protein n=1 Tax=Trichocladium antarcticum TaxID=1450529 RepID=A0AAN6ZBP0_9PEZI|nr:hypothetical protein BT67DRAFT_133508 [Trichocladium antarcticum]